MNLQYKSHVCKNSIRVMCTYPHINLSPWASSEDHSSLHIGNVNMKKVTNVLKLIDMSPFRHSSSCYSSARPCCHQLFSLRLIPSPCHHALKPEQPSQNCNLWDKKLPYYSITRQQPGSLRWQEHCTVWIIDSTDVSDARQALRKNLSSTKTRSRPNLTIH